MRIIKELMEIWLNEVCDNNKVYSSTRTLLFKANYRQNPRIRFKMRKKGKYKGAEKFVTKIKEI